MMRIMTNNEYSFELATRIKQLDLLRKEAISLSAGIIGQTLFKEEFYFCASVDRCVHLVDGFVSMLKDRNLTCVGVLLRMQMDNCMRSYAPFIAQDKDAVIDCIISGKQINKEKDKCGKQLSDSYLKKQMAKIDPVFEQVYNKASGYVHMSEKAFYQTLVKCENYSIEFQVGCELPEKCNPFLLEAADAFIHFIHLHFVMLNEVSESKKRYDDSHLDENEIGSQHVD